MTEAPSIRGRSRGVRPGSGRYRAPLLAAVASLLVLATATGAAADPDLAPADLADGLSSCTGAISHAFADVPVGQAHEGAIACLHEAGVVAGRSSTEYAPSATLTFGQLATFVVRAAAVAEVELPEATAGMFDGGSATHGESISRLAAAGLLPVAAWQFDARATVSRSAMARQIDGFLDRAGVLEEVVDDAGLTDVDEDPSRDAITRLAQAGVVRGRTDGRFLPAEAVRRDQMASFLTRALALIERGGEPLDFTPESTTAPEGWLLAGGTGPDVGTGGTAASYTVEIADGLESRMPLAEFAARVERTLGDPDHGWTAKGTWRLQRVDTPSAARVRVLLASPATVDRLCAEAGLRTAGIYSCWNGRFAAINADRWFQGVDHVADLELYRTYLVNHEVGHGLGQDHLACGGSGQLAPVMMQLTKSTYGCVPNGLPHP